MTLPTDLQIMQAPIGPATTRQLVAAVSSCGALGTLAGSWTPPARLREHVREIRAATQRPFCVNLVLAFDQRERLDVVIEECVPVVSFSWGIDRELIERAAAAGVIVLVQVGTAAEGAAASAAGAAGLIAQGVEAGGHVQGRTPLLTLVSELRAVGGMLIVAAGGIGGPQAVRRAMDTGADAVACGTAFLVADEADTHPAYRQRLLAAGPHDTELTGLFDGGWPDAPHRVLRNDTLSDWEAAGRPAPGHRPNEGEVVAWRGSHPIARYSDAQPTRRTTGNAEAMAMYAGRSVGEVSAAASAATIVRMLAQGIA